MEIKVVSVIGGGTMGNGIAHLFAMKGFLVYLVEDFGATLFTCF